jgi:hypothetical protein
MGPAQQSLESVNLVGAQAHQRLIVQLERPVGESLPKLDLQLEPRLHPLVHLDFEEAIGPLALAFGAMQSEIGAPQERRGIGVAVSGEGDANACAEREPAPIDLERLLHGGQEAARE